MSVTRDEVIWAYRLLLGRYPESESVIQLHTQCANIEALRKNFMLSSEFSKILSSTKKSTFPFLPLDVAKIEVDTTASNAQLSALIEKTKAVWTRLAVKYLRLCRRYLTAKRLAFLLLIIYGIV
ncbi:MAG: hypothetical protein ABSC04_17340 [Syntrophobacteraceae bacterium]|jgi:hypothetical protein